MSGAPHYLEGKILSVSKLMDENGNPTSTGEAQALAVQLEITAWGLENAIVSVVFDTTASNTGKYRGATQSSYNCLFLPDTTNRLFLSGRGDYCD